MMPGVAGMMPLAVGTAGTVLAVIGLVVGLVVLFVVISLLTGVLVPLRKVLKDVQSAKTAPMLERGVPGTEQLGQTRRLAESVPDLALAYLQKLSSAPKAPAPAPAPAPAAESAPQPVQAAAPAQSEAQSEPQQPAWKKWRQQ